MHPESTKSLALDPSSSASEGFAMQQLSLPFRHAFVAEKSKPARAFISQNHTVGRVFSDMLNPDFLARVPPCQILVAGFPARRFRSKARAWA